MPSIGQWLRDYVEDKSPEARAGLQAIAWRLCASELERLTSLPPVPRRFEQVKGKSYQSTPSDWAAWRLIGFSLGGPQRYQYRVEADRDGKSARIIAEGDVDGDGTRSRFSKSVEKRPRKNCPGDRRVEEQEPRE